MARTSPDDIVRRRRRSALGSGRLPGARPGLAVGLTGDPAKVFASSARSLFKAFLDCDCSLLEVNPFALTEAGVLAALDSKMVIDDDALFRQPALAALRDTSEEEPAEVEAQAVGVRYVKLDGNVGCMVNGAGLAMATMDTIKLHGGQPANFLDIGGGANAGQIGAALGIILKDETSAPCW